MEHVDSALSKVGEKVYSVEGENTLRWVLMDYSDLIVHVFDEEIRSFYALERLWGDAPKIEIKDPVGSRKKRSAPKSVRKVVGSQLKKGKAV